MPEERTHEVRSFLQRAHEAQRKFLHLLGSLDDAAAQLVAFQMRPDVLVGIEIGRVGRQSEQPQFAVEPFDELADLGAAMHRMTIDHQEDWPRCALHQSLQKLDEDVRGEVPLGGT